MSASFVKQAYKALVPGLREKAAKMDSTAVAQQVPPLRRMLPYPVFEESVISRFKTILDRIMAGEDVSQSELMPFLILERKENRLEVNRMLGTAYATAQRWERAKPFIERAWYFSQYDPELLPVFEKVHQNLGATAAIRAAYKQCGMAAARRDDFETAIEYFDKFQYAYATFDREDRYLYDDDVLAAIEKMSEPHRFPQATSAPLGQRKIKIGYLLRGIVEINSILMRVAKTIATCHDKTQFDITFFAVESSEQVDESKQGRDHFHELKRLGCNVVLAPSGLTLKQRLLEVGRRIHEHQLDMFITIAGLADFSQYFLGCLRPAPVMLSLVQGPPAQYVPPFFDWSISWSKHPLIDAPAHCSYIPVKSWDLNTPAVDPAPRSEIGVPADHVLLLSVGRHLKFQDRDYWTAVVRLLQKHKNASFVAAGPARKDVPFLDTVLTPDVADRVHLLGWRTDSRQLTASADIIVDTYPNGGGQSIVEAMSLGIPVVAHSNDYMIAFDQTQWSPADDFLSDPQLLVPRADWERFVSSVSKLIENPDLRKQAGESCRKTAQQFDTASNIKETEEVYRRVIQLFSGTGY